MRNFFSELRRRKVYRFAIAYAVVSWLLIQVATQVFPFLQIPSWIITLIIVLIVLGFPLALVLSWFFDLTPQGVIRSADVVEAAPPTAALPAETRIPPRSALPRPVPEKSIAVLPFENLSDDPHNAYFADGMHDDIITHLAKIADLKVISRTSVQQYKTGVRKLREIGEELGVAHILEGTVRRAGNRIRVNAQLINAQSDLHVWGESFDRELTDLFAMQTELAQCITVALRANLSPREQASMQVRPTTNLHAHELYLRARDLFRWSGTGDAQENGERALPLLEEAVALDPQFAVAYALSSRVHTELYWFGCDKRRSRLELAREAAEIALRLQPNLGEAHLALGFYHYYAARDYERARAELAEALRSTPNDSEVIGALGILDRRQARWQDAITHLEDARALDPRNTAAIWNLVETCIYLFRYEEAERIIADALAVSPNAHFFPLARASLALRRNGDVAPLRRALAAVPADFDPGGAVTIISVRVALMERDYDEAERRLSASSEGWCNDIGLSGMAGAIDGYTVPNSWYRGLIAQGRGDRDVARREFLAAQSVVAQDLAKWPEDEKTMAMLGLVHAALGEREEAMRLGRRAVELLPILRDALDGPLLASNLALIYAWVGEPELALDELTPLVDLPGGPTRGLLRAEPEWDGLRDHPRFRQLAGI